MIKKKVCKTKRGKWSEEYKVKLSVKPVKRKKGNWQKETKSSIDKAWERHRKRAKVKASGRGKTPKNRANKKLFRAIYG